MDKRIQIVDIIQRLAGEPINPSPEESLFESGLLDSFALADMVTALEKQFSIRVPDSDFKPRKFDSIASIEAYVQSRS